jgi:hypothetical protein
MPDSASAQAKLTVTAVLFQPKLFAAGTRFGVMVGGMLSIRMVIECPGIVASSTLPAWSSLQKVTVWVPPPLTVTFPSGPTA